MDFNLEKLKDHREGIGSITNSLKTSYDSGWDDSVHDSFGAFIEEYDKQIKNMESLMAQLQGVCDSLESVNIDELNDSCDALLSQID